MIPRLIHQIWVGPKPLPEKFAAWAAELRTKHPGWEYRLWHDLQLEDLIQQHFPQHLATYRGIQKYAQKADLGRYMIVAVMGGLYLDTDCECRRALDFVGDADELIVAPELRTRSPKVKGIYRTARDELYCTWAFLARPGHPFFFSLVDEVAQRLQRKISDDPVVNVVDQSGPGAFTDVLHRYLATGGKARVIPGSWFGCPDGASLFRFNRSYLFPELFRLVYIRHRSDMSWIDPKEKREWMIRNMFLLGPPKRKAR